MRKRAVLSVLTLLLTCGVQAKNGDSFKYTYTLQGVGSGAVGMLEMNGKLLMNADELARALSRAGWLDKSFAAGFRAGLIPVIQPGGNHFADPAVFAQHFNLTIRVDRPARKLLVARGAAPKAGNAPVTSSSSTSGANPVQAPSPVQSTRQLDGENALPGQTFTLGKSSPLNFTLNRAEYSVGRLVIGDTVYSPRADQKLLILHYTVHNPQKRELRYHWSDLNFTAVDAQDRNHTNVQAVAREGTSEELTMQLKPAQKVDVVTAVLVPAAGPVPKLIVSRERGAPVLRYDLRGKVTVLPAPFADPADPSGATARAQVSAPAATFLPLGWVDVRLDEVRFTSEALGGQAPAKGKRYLAAVFTIKNHGPRETRYHWGDFKPALKDADGERLAYNEKMLKASRDEKASGMLPAGEETRVRFFWEVPAAVGADTLYFTDRQGLTYAFDVKSVR